MNHPGVKSLFERICKTNGLKPSSSTLVEDSEDQISITKFNKLSFNKSPNDSLIIEDSKPLMSGIKKVDTLTNSTQSCKLLGFKEQLRQRMKEKRQQIRKEEEEDDRMDEEYHDVKKSDDENDDNNDDDDLVDLDKKDANEKIESLNTNDNNNDDSDDDFKLNLNEDEESDLDEKVNSKNKNKKNKKSKNVYDFDEDDEDDDENRKEIMSTNTIPSNQLIKNPKRTQSFMNMDDLVVVSNKQSMLDDDEDDALASESFKAHHNETDSQDNKSNDENKEGEEAEEEVFDELAMLCSGQFRSSNSK
jgi:hypothetical protein